MTQLDIFLYDFLYLLHWFFGIK